MVKKASKKASNRKPAKKPAVNKGGRPSIEVDLKKITELCRFMLADYELAAALGMSPRTFTNKKAENPAIAEAMEEGYNMGKRSLRSRQLQIAMGGNVAMLIWLGKQYLGQKDKTLHGNDPEAPFNDIDNLTAEQLAAEIAEHNRRLGYAPIVAQTPLANFAQPTMETVGGTTNGRAE